MNYLGSDHVSSFCSKWRRAYLQAAGAVQCPCRAPAHALETARVPPEWRRLMAPSSATSLSPPWAQCWFGGSIETDDAEAPEYIAEQMVF